MGGVNITYLIKEVSTFNKLWSEWMLRPDRFELGRERLTREKQIMNMTIVDGDTDNE